MVANSCAARTGSAYLVVDETKGHIAVSGWATGTRVLVVKGGALGDEPQRRPTRTPSAPTTTSDTTTLVTMFLPIRTVSCVQRGANRVQRHEGLPRRLELRHRTRRLRPTGRSDGPRHEGCRATRSPADNTARSALIRGSSLWSSIESNDTSPPRWLDNKESAPCRSSWPRQTRATQLLITAPCELRWRTNGSNRVRQYDVAIHAAVPAAISPIGGQKGR